MLTGFVGTSFVARAFTASSCGTARGRGGRATVGCARHQRSVLSFDDIHDRDTMVRITNCDAAKGSPVIAFVHL